MHITEKRDYKYKYKLYKIYHNELEWYLISIKKMKSFVFYNKYKAKKCDNNYQIKIIHSYRMKEIL